METTPVEAEHDRVRAFVRDLLNDRLNHEKQRLHSASALFNSATHLDDKLRLCGKMQAYQHGIELLTDLLRDLS